GFITWPMQGKYQLDHVADLHYGRAKRLSVCRFWLRPLHAAAVVKTCLLLCAGAGDTMPHAVLRRRQDTARSRSSSVRSCCRYVAVWRCQSKWAALCMAAVAHCDHKSRLASRRHKALPIAASSWGSTSTPLPCSPTMLQGPPRLVATSGRPQRAASIRVRPNGSL